MRIDPHDSSDVAVLWMPGRRQDKDLRDRRRIVLMLETLKAHIEAVIRGERAGSTFPLRLLLQIAAVFYRSAVQLRIRAYERGLLKSYRLHCCVISVGNIVVGGTGKTPITIHLAERLSRMGRRVVVVSRGYRGSMEASGGIVSDGQRLLMDAAQAGDEPYLMAETLLKWGVPVLVGKDRVASGELAVRRFLPDVVLLDDGFQHLRLRRDIDIVLLDANQPLGNGRQLPAGPLREPETNLARCSAVIITRCQPESVRCESPDSLRVSGINGLPVFEKPIFFSTFRPFFRSGVAGHESNRAANLKGRRVFLFSGIARNVEFRRSVEELGGVVTGACDYTDHHAYTPGNIDHIDKSAVQSGAEMILTTEKDGVKLSSANPFSLPWGILGIETDMGVHDSRFEAWLAATMNRRSRTCSG